MSAPPPDHPPPTDDASPVEPVPAVAEPTEPALIPPAGLVAVLLAILLAVAGAAIVWAPPVSGGLRPSLVLDDWQTAVDLGAMRARDDALLRLARDTTAEAKLEQSWSVWLATEATAGVHAAEEAPAARVALGEAEERVRALAVAGGTDAVRAWSVAYGRRVRAAAQAVASQAQTHHQSMALRLAEVPTPTDVTALAQVAGGLGRTLAATGLGARPWSPAEGQVVEVLAQQRALLLGQRLRGGPLPLPSDAWLLLQRFRVEAHEGLRLERKLQLLAETEQADAATPAAWLRGILLARAGAWSEARVAFEQAAVRGEHPAQSRVNARWCAEMAAAAR